MKYFYTKEKIKTSNIVLALCEECNKENQSLVIRLFTELEKTEKYIKALKKIMLNGFNDCLNKGNECQCASCIAKDVLKEGEL